MSRAARAKGPGFGIPCTLPVYLPVAGVSHRSGATRNLSVGDGEVVGTPEVRLFAAVLARAARDFLRPHVGLAGVRSKEELRAADRHHRAAADWIWPGAGEGRPEPAEYDLTFDEACHFAGVCPSRFRAALERLVREGPRGRQKRGWSLVKTLAS